MLSFGFAKHILEYIRSVALGQVSK